MQVVAGRMSPVQRALRVAGWYTLAGTLWLLFSGRLITRLFPAEAVADIRIYGGWVFVAVSAAVVFLATLRVLQSQAKTNQTIVREQLKLKAYLEQAPMAVFILDLQGRCLEANQQAADLVGCDMKTLLTLGIADLTPPGEDTRIAQTAMETLATKRWVEGDFRLRRTDGGIIWIHARSAGLDNERFIACAYDVTQRIAAEARLRQAAVVFRSTREGIVITDRHARILTVNRAFTDITGWDEADVRGREPSILKSGVQDREWYRTMWRDVNEAGYWQGEIWNRRKNGDMYPEWLTISAVKDDEGNVTNYIGVFTDITRIKHSEAELDYLAHSDALTGLANRLLLDSRIDHALTRASANGRNVAIAALDIDGFKQINEALGMEAGDDVLRAVADRLRNDLGSGDTVARIGADEFIVVREDLLPLEVSDFANQLTHIFTQPVTLPSGREMHLSASVGISVFPDDGTARADLMKNAISAVAPVRAAGGKSYGFHTAAMEETARRRLALEDELRHALRRGEFLLYYQPRVLIDSGRIEGVEALLRWKLPDGSIRQPDEFIGIAEAMGIIEPIGQWAIEEACRQYRSWAAQARPLDTISVNVSPVQLRDSGFLSRVTSALASSGMPASALELEITEGLTLDPGKDIDERLAAISAHGIRIAIDDFGIGYSSLSRLARLPVHTLKVDRTFVTRTPQETIGCEMVATIVSMAANLGLATVAEGVETEAQWTFLKDCGCNLAQGYLFCRPVPPESITPLIANAR